MRWLLVTVRGTKGAVSASAAFTFDDESCPIIWMVPCGVRTADEPQFCLTHRPGLRQSAIQISIEGCHQSPARKRCPWGLRVATGNQDRELPHSLTSSRASVAGTASIPIGTEGSSSTSTTSAVGKIRKYFTARLNSMKPAAVIAPVTAISVHLGM